MIDTVTIEITFFITFFVLISIMWYAEYKYWIVQLSFTCLSDYPQLDRIFNLLILVARMNFRLSFLNLLINNLIKNKIDICKKNVDLLSVARYNCRRLINVIISHLMFLNVSHPDFSHAIATPEPDFTGIMDDRWNVGDSYKHKRSFVRRNAGSWRPWPVGSSSEGRANPTSAAFCSFETFHRNCSAIV